MPQRTRRARRYLARSAASPSSHRSTSRVWIQIVIAALLVTAFVAVTWKVEVREQTSTAASVPTQATAPVEPTAAQPNASPAAVPASAAAVSPPIPAAAAPAAALAKATATPAKTGITPVLAWKQYCLSHPQLACEWKGEHIKMHAKRFTDGPLAGLTYRRGFPYFAPMRRTDRFQDGVVVNTLKLRKALQVVDATIPIRENWNEQSEVAYLEIERRVNAEPDLLGKIQTFISTGRAPRSPNMVLAPQPASRHVTRAAKFGTPAFRLASANSIQSLAVSTAAPISLRPTKGGLPMTTPWFGQQRQIFALRAPLPYLPEIGEVERPVGTLERRLRLVMPPGDEWLAAFNRR